MLEKLESIDREILLFINHHNTEWLDSVMWVISSKWFWIPIIALFVVLAAVKFAKKCWKPILLACLCFATTDFGSHSVKESVKRYRPTHNLEIADQIHVVNDYRGGMYGFFSGHSANGFGLALLTLLLLRKKRTCSNSPAPIPAR
ncbi:MAG: hypothetical protein HUK15_05070 [Bacteroidales bacterium]|nr:hypothetical protein [Bacteroidales bacterium]